MLARVSLIGERLKSDEMARHGSMMVAFVFLGGLFGYLYQLSMGRMLSPAEYGTLFSLTSLFMIFMVFSQTIQTSIAKFTSTFKVENRTGRIKFLWRTACGRDDDAGDYAGLEPDRLLHPSHVLHYLSDNPGSGGRGLFLAQD